MASVLQPKVQKVRRRFYELNGERVRAGQKINSRGASSDACCSVRATPPILGSMPTCLSCGLEVPVGSRFCPSCGAALTEAAAPEEMLKLVTVLFADVVGSTSRAESLHPEEVRAVMADYFVAMRGRSRPRAAPWRSSSAMR